MIEIGKYNPIFFGPRKYRYGTGSYTQRFDTGDKVVFEFLSGSGETAEVRLNNLSTGESEDVAMKTFAVSDSMDAHYAELSLDEGFYTVTIGDVTSSVESEPFRVCSCADTTALMEYGNADNNVDGGAFVDGDYRIPFMFRFEGGDKARGHGAQM